MRFKFRIILNNLLLQYCLIFVWAKNIPSYFHICKTNNQLNECFVNSVRDLLPYLAKGIPELNLSPIEPLHIANINTSIGSAAINLDAELQNGIVSGLADLVVRKTEVHLDSARFTVDCHVPTVTIKGNYQLRGKILLFEVEGKGIVTFNATGVDCFLIWSGKFYTQNGNKYIKLEKIEATLKFKKMELNLENLFDRNELLTRSVNDAINQNMDVILQDLDPIITQNVEDVILDYSNRILPLFTMDQLFPSE